MTIGSREERLPFAFRLKMSSFNYFVDACLPTSMESDGFFFVESKEHLRFRKILYMAR